MLRGSKEQPYRLMIEEELAPTVETSFVNTWLHEGFIMLKETKYISEGIAR